MGSDDLTSAIRTPAPGRSLDERPSVLERRSFLRIMGGVAGAAIARGAGLSPFSGKPVYGQSIGPNLTKFVDSLPIPRTMSPVGILDGAPFFDVRMRQFSQKLHRDLPPTTLWGYEGQYPGPTFDVRRGRPIAVRWRNGLPATHLLPIDPTLHGAQPPTPPVRTVVHLHGHKVLPDSDGYPEAWFTNGFAQTGAFFVTQIYHYPNDQPAAGLWYHDHALGITRLNIYAGLGGFYFIRDDDEDALDLPRGTHEIPLMIQDRALGSDGSLLYPVQAPGDPEVPPVWVPEFFGDTVLVNGRVWPFLEVEATRYRFRMLNASNARVYRLTLNESTPRRVPSRRPGPPFIQIGSDGGFLPAPVRLTELTIAPAERCDVIIDFSRREGTCFVLNNDAKAPFPDGDDVIPTDVMLFKVTGKRGCPRTGQLPSRLPAVPPLDPASAVRVRNLVLKEAASAQDNPIEGLINAHWGDPVTEDPRAGSTEIWRIINTTDDAHPIHVHLVQFQVLDHQPFDVEQYPSRLVFTGPRMRPPRNERDAPKDTVKAFPGEITRIIARFDLPDGTGADHGKRFRYVFHCHILEHEDNDMMRPYDVVG